MNTGNHDPRYRFECECREWVRLVEKNGRGWWNSKKFELGKKWGAERLQKLIEGMNKQRK